MNQVPHFRLKIESCQNFRPENDLLMEEGRQSTTGKLDNLGLTKIFIILILIPVVNILKTSQELQMLSTVTLNCQVREAII